MNTMNQFEKQERFKNKAYKRVEKIENSLAVLSCFANRELYDYSASEVMTLFNRIETVIIDTRKNTSKNFKEQKESITVMKKIMTMRTNL